MKQKKALKNGEKTGKKSLFKSRKFKYGGFATLFTVIFLVAVVILNVIATALVDRYPLTLDLTSTDACLRILPSISRDWINRSRLTY